MLTSKLSACIIFTRYFVHLLDSVLKEQFSDGVDYGWIDSLKREAETLVTDLIMKFASSRFSVSTPKTKEEYMYR